MSGRAPTAAPVRLGLVGCGRLAEQGYVPAVARCAAVELVAIADPDRDRRESVAARVRGATGQVVSAHADAASLLSSGSVGALVLATPVATHLADVERAAAAGVPVLVEKPPAADAVDAAALAAVGGQVWLGFNRRFELPVADLRARIPTSGRLDVELRLTYRRASWGAHTVRDDVVLDLVPHLADLARWLTGSEAGSVAAEELTPDRARLQVELARGRARILAAADRLHEERIVVRAAGGRPVAGHRTGGPLGAVLGRVDAVRALASGRPAPHPLVASLAAQLTAFAAAVRGDDPGPLATPADGVAAMCVIDAARTSGRAGGTPVTVPDLREPTC